MNGWRISLLHLMVRAVYLQKDKVQYAAVSVVHLHHVTKSQGVIHGDTKKNGNFWKTQQKLKKSKKKKIIDRNWTITTFLLRDSNPNYQCWKITSCRWHPPPRMHSFTATTHFKSSRSFVSPCACCMLCRMRICCRPPAGNIVGALYHKQ